MTDAYIDSTLRFDWNVSFNQKLCDALEEKGISVYLPQRDTDQQNRDAVFQQNKEAMDNAKVIIAVAKNESPNWGVEVGYGYGLNKPVICVSETDHDIPLMATHMMKDIIKTDNLENINNYIEELVLTINNFK